MSVHATLGSGSVEWQSRIVASVENGCSINRSRQVFCYDRLIHEGAEDPAESDELLGALRNDLQWDQRPRSSESLKKESFAKRTQQAFCYECLSREGAEAAAEFDEYRGAFSPWPAEASMPSPRVWASIWRSCRN